MGEIRCCRNRTSLEIILLTLLTIAIILLLLCGISFLLEPYSDDVCTEEICLKASQKFLNFIDKSVNPCDNFYEFACGNFIKNYAEIYGISTPIEEYLLKANKKLLRVAEDPPNLMNDSKSLVIAKKLYRKCVTDNPSIKERDDLILNLIKQIGGWPMVQSNWNDSKFIWINMVLKARNLGLKYNWILEITEDLGLPTISFPKQLESGMDENLRSQYQFLIAEVARYFGTPSTTAWMDAEEIENFQHNLIRIVKKNKQDREHHQAINIDEFQNKYPDFNWIDLISNITRMNRNAFANHKILIEVIYYEEFYKLLQDTPARVQVNYFVWKTIEDFYPFLSSPLQEIFNNFLLLKDRKLKERAELCLQFVRSRMKNVIEGAFIRKNINTHLIENIEYLIDSIKNKMVDRILANKWMDRLSQANAIRKIKNIRNMIGGPPHIFQAEAFDQYYGLDKFEWESNNTIYMINELQLNYYQKTFEHIYVMPSGDFAETTPWGTINGRYFFSVNTIILTPMILGADFYDDNYPQFLNYGGLGTVIAHELAHSLDIRFPYITENGDEFWIKPESEEIFLEKLDCISREYDHLMGKQSKNHSDDDVGVVLSENSADFLGIDFAFEAYQDAIKIIRTDKVLPIMNYKPNKLFWLQYASYMCYRKIQMSSVDLDNDVHSFPEFRVIGPIRNSKYFAKVFDCDVGTKMNPADKCQLI